MTSPRYPVVSGHGRAPSLRCSVIATARSYMGGVPPKSPQQRRRRCIMQRSALYTTVQGPLEKRFRCGCGLVKHGKAIQRGDSLALPKLGHGLCGAFGPRDNAPIAGLNEVPLCLSYTRSDTASSRRGLPVPRGTRYYHAGKQRPLKSL